MKRAPSEDLFRLIRSLSKGEKRNFKLLAGLLASEKDKKYVALFDVIDKQEVYNEGKVSKLTKDLYGGQLAVGKHYLFKLILKSLVYYRNNPSCDLNNVVEQVKVLAEKDLYPQANKLLRKAIQEAEAIEAFPTHYALLGLQLELLLRTQNEKRLAERIAVLEQERAVIMRRMANLDAYKALSNRAFMLLQTRQVANGAFDMAALRDLQRDPLVADIDRAHSARARIEFYSLQRKFASFGADLESAVHFSNQLLNLYDALPLLKEEFLRDYFAELGNVCTYLLRLGRVKEAFSKMEEFRLFREQYPKSRVDFFQLYFVMVLAAAIHVGEPERALAMEEEIEAELLAMDGKISKSHEMWLKYLLAYAHFMSGKPKSALRWINKLLKEPRNDVRIDIQSNARMLNLMIHFELGNYMLVESEVLSTKRFLDKHEQLQEYERQLLRCIKALAVAADGPGVATVAENWFQRMVLYDSSLPANVSKLLDFTDWLQSQVQARSMASVRQSKLESVHLEVYGI